MLISQKEYEDKKAVLDAIERATRVDMGFQKGKLSVETGRTILSKSPSDPSYNSFDAGVAYVYSKLHQMMNMLQGQASHQNEMNQMLSEKDEPVIQSPRGSQKGY